MGKASATDSDRGLVGAQTITANGATTGILVPTGQVLNVAVSVPSGVTGTLEMSFDNSAWFTMTPSSMALIDATAAAKAQVTTFYTEEPGVWLRCSGAGTWGGGTLSFRVSGQGLGV